MRLLALVLAAAFLSAPAAARLSQQSLTIDGSKNPEMFPQWYVWELTFQNLQGDSKQQRFPLQRQLGLSDVEYKVLMDEVKVFERLTESLKKDLAETRAEATAQGKKEDQIRDATQVVNVNYRYKVLEGRQRVYDQLRPERMLLLRAYIDRIVKGTRVFLAGRMLLYFKQPW